MDQRGEVPPVETTSDPMASFRAWALGLFELLFLFTLIGSAVFAGSSDVRPLARVVARIGVVLGLAAAGAIVLALLARRSWAFAASAWACIVLIAGGAGGRRRSAPTSIGWRSGATTSTAPGEPPSADRPGQAATHMQRQVLSSFAIGRRNEVRAWRSRIFAQGRRAHGLGAWRRLPVALGPPGGLRSSMAAPAASARPPAYAYGSVSPASATTSAPHSRVGPAGGSGGPS